MITAGIDLATEPETTALATIEWGAGAAVVTSLRLGVLDDMIIDSAAAATKLGIDCPLGWPDDFVAFVNAHHTDHVVAPEDVAGKDWRRRLAYRATDRAIRETTGLTPLSVAADRIGLTAMRAAGLLARLAKAGRPVDRAGGGVVVEVYPAASLHQWRLPHKAYKGRDNAPARARLLQQLLAAAPWLDLREHADLCAHSDDALDAVIAALTSRAAARHQVSRPADPEPLAQAQREGWIALPDQPLAALI